MSVGLISWGRFYRKNPVDGTLQRITVPAPVDDPTKPWLWDFIRTEAKKIGGSFDFVQLPPTSLTQSGEDATGDGYGIVWRRQMNGTRYGGPNGTEKLMAAIAALKNHGVLSYGDLSLHQFAKMTKAYPNNAKGAQTEGWFRGHTSWNSDTNTWNDPIPPYCEEDDVPAPWDDFPFGKEISYQHCNPPGVTENDAKDFLKWFKNRFDIAHFRFDDVKGMHVQSVRRIMDAVPDAEFYSEYFDNAWNAGNWATSAPMYSRSAVEDFDLHWRLQAICDLYDATHFEKEGAGYWVKNPGLAVGFTDNPDTDTSPTQQIIFNKRLAYAVLLNLPMRHVLVYGKDYYPDSVWPGAYGMHETIDNLCWISRTFAFGKFERRWVDKDVYVFTRDGDGGQYGWSGGLLVGVNFNDLTPRTVTVRTMWPRGTRLHDYRGPRVPPLPDLWVGEDGYVSLTIPSNAYSHGESSVCYAPTNSDGSPVDHGVYRPSLETHQTYVCALGEDIGQVLDGSMDLPQRLRIKKGTTLHLVCRIYRVPSSDDMNPVDAAIEARVFNSKQELIAANSTGTASSVTIDVAIEETDWYTISLVGKNMPLRGLGSNVEVSYFGTED